MDRAHQRGGAHQRHELIPAGNGLKKANITLDRKILSEIAIHDPPSFGAVAKLAIADSSDIERAVNASACHSSASMGIEESLASLGERYRAAFSQAETEQALRQEYAQASGKGELTSVLAQMRHVPGPEKPAIGAKVNAFRQAVEDAFTTRLGTITRSLRQAELSGRPFDLTLPGRFESVRGHPHPIYEARDDLLAMFRDLGFATASGPEVELEVNNFTKLAFPEDHPAADMQDSFWVKAENFSARVLLRTHTSNVQVREMSARAPPLAVVSAGAVYRRDDDMTHSPMFHQIEGFLVDDGVNVSHLKGVLSAFAERLYGAGTTVRFRPSYFPFVEPGMAAT